MQQDEELYMLARSGGRQAKERGMRRRRLKQYWNRLKEISDQNPDILRERCLNHFATLGIPLRPEALDAGMQRAEKEAFSPLAFLDLVVGEQAAQRRERSTQRRISEARFAEMKTLEAIDWNFNSKAINRAQFEKLATGDFIRRRANLL